MGPHYCLGRLVTLLLSFVVLLVVLSRAFNVIKVVVIFIFITRSG
jgi:hypothetical protein